MPFYDFQCCKCGKIQELKFGMTETIPIIICECGYTCRKMISNVVVHGSTDIGDYDIVRAHRPKTLTFKDGHKEKFDYSKHGTGPRGSGEIKPKKKQK